ncbi:MAG: DUF2079 domain-containing protein [bacterium]|nr:DUF2079 domain-containing protein [bacterium]
MTQPHQHDADAPWMTITLRRLALAGMIALFTLAVSAVGFFKYRYLLYNGLDLAIYTNVLANLAAGNGWWSDIQQHSYLGDHVEPVLLLLIPIFRVWSDARLLVIVQALVLGLTAVPVYALLRRSRWSLLLTALWLGNPLFWNAALFEFHALAFAPVLLLSAGYFFLQRRFLPFILFLILALFVREDIALIAMMFGVVAIVLRFSSFSSRLCHCEPSPRGVAISANARDRCVTPMTGIAASRTPRNDSKKWYWMLLPLLLGIAWFSIATRIAAVHSPAGAYPFLVYYGWLGESFGEVIVNTIGHPVLVAQHLLRLSNLDFVLGLLLPFLFLPFLAPAWFLLALPPAAQVLLTASGGSNLMVQMHYGLLFVPALVLATLRSPLFQRGDTGGWYGGRVATFFGHWFPLPHRAAMMLGVSAYIAVAFLLGPFPGIARAAVFGATDTQRVQAQATDVLLAAVPDNAVISASASVITRVAARRGTTYLPNAALGQQQYAFAPYVLPSQTTHVLAVIADMAEEYTALLHVSWTKPYAADAPARLARLLEDGGFRVAAERDGVFLLARGADGPAPPLELFTPAERITHRIIGPLREVEAAP